MTQFGPARQFGRTPHRATAGRRGQAGLTLVEILLALAITVAVVAPVTAWTVLALRSQGLANEALELSNAAGFLRTGVTRDVASAALVSAGGSDCIGGDGTGTVVLQVLPAGAPRRVVYTESARPDGSRSLWRRECRLSPDELVSATELLTDVAPGGTTVSCPDVAGTPAGADPCEVDRNRQVQLRVVPRLDDGTSAAALEVRALRRTSSASTGVASPDNRPPVAEVVATPDQTYVGAPVQLSAQRSRDLDGAVTAYRWTLPADASCDGSDGDVVRNCTFGAAGGRQSRIVTVTVTDDRGATNSAATTIAVLNRYPQALATPPAAPVRIGQPFTLSDGGSVDPEGEPLTYTWNLGDDIVLTGPTPTFTFPPGTRVGPRTVTLVVADPAGGTDADVVQLDVQGEPGGPDPTPVGGVLITPTPVPVAGKAPRVGDAVGASLPPTTVGFAASDGASVTWRLSRRGGALVAEAAGPTWTRSFGPGDAGDYEIVRITRTAGQPDVVGPPVAFRINAAPVPAFTSSGTGGAPRTVSFSTAGSSDPDGSIVSWRWNFGFFDRWTSTNPDPVHTFTNPGAYGVVLEVVDDEGARATTFAPVVVPGPPFAPPPPRWSGQQVGWDPVPGADRYRVTLQYPCTSPQVEVAPSLTPRVVAASTTALCGAPGPVAAVLEVRAGGVWGPPSAGAAGPAS